MIEIKELEISLSAKALLQSKFENSRGFLEFVMKGQDLKSINGIADAYEKEIYIGVINCYKKKNETEYHYNPEVIYIESKDYGFWKINVLFFLLTVILTVIVVFVWWLITS